MRRKKEEEKGILINRLSLLLPLLGWRWQGERRKGERRSPFNSVKKRKGRRKKELQRGKKSPLLKEPLSERNMYSHPFFAVWKKPSYACRLVAGGDGMISHTCREGGEDLPFFFRPGIVAYVFACCCDDILPSSPQSHPYLLAMLMKEGGKGVG